MRTSSPILLPTTTPAVEHHRFRHFRLVPGARALFREDRPVYLGGRAFDLLHLLVQRRGEVVSKREIIARVWPGLTVDETNLRFQMAALRKALGEDRDLIRTVPGHGYILADDVSGGDLHESGGYPAALPPPEQERRLPSMGKQDGRASTSASRVMEELLQDVLAELRRLGREPSASMLLARDAAAAQSSR